MFFQKYEENILPPRLVYFNLKITFFCTLRIPFPALPPFRVPQDGRRPCAKPATCLRKNAAVLAQGFRGRDAGGLSVRAGGRRRQPFFLALYSVGDRPMCFVNWREKYKASSNPTNGLIWLIFMSVKSR